MKIIIPMAGLGTRFQKVSDQNPEFRKPKPFINVKGWPMVRWATACLTFFRHPEQQKKDFHRADSKDITFVILREHDRAHHIEKQLKDLYSQDINIVILDSVTRGAAETAYMAKEFMDPEEELIISDSDHFFDGTSLHKAIEQKNPETVGIIPVFRARNEGIPKWSYSLIKSGTSIIEKVAEKDRELMERGAHANIGAYYFTKAKYFIDVVEEMIGANKMTGEVGKSEFYVAPLYQMLIEKGYQVEAAETPEVWGLGTPSDLEYFLLNYKSDKI